MIVGIYHTITDTQKFWEVAGKVDTMNKGGKLPKGIKGLTFAPSTDGRKAFCLWEADSINSLKSLLEPLTGTAARNEYFEVDAQKSEGLPQEPVTHAAA